MQLWISLCVLGLFYLGHLSADSSEPLLWTAVLDKSEVNQREMIPVYSWTHLTAFQMQAHYSMYWIVTHVLWYALYSGAVGKGQTYCIWILVVLAAVYPEESVFVWIMLWGLFVLLLMVGSYHTPGGLGYTHLMKYLYNSETLQSNFLNMNRHKINLQTDCIEWDLISQLDVMFFIYVY